MIIPASTIKLQQYTTFIYFMKSRKHCYLFYRPIQRQSEYNDFKAFFQRSFTTLSPAHNLIPNWHIDFLCEILIKVYYGKIKKLIVCMPPRYMKSLCISTAFPAWVLSQNSSQKVIVASYAMPLAEKLSIDTRTILNEQWFKEGFPNVIIKNDVNSKRKFATTTGGFRLATSINGSLTGEGGDILIADDPQKPVNIGNKKYREKTFDWLSNTFFSRLNSKKDGKIIIVMQRLHADDIIGRLTENKIEDQLLQEINDWHIVCLPAIAKNDEPYRRKGDALNPEMEDLPILHDIKKQMGQYHFNAQYQQSPNNTGCGFLKKSQIHLWHEEISTDIGVFISVDSAFKSGEHNDFTAISIWTEVMVNEKATLALVDVVCKKLEFNDLVAFLRKLFEKYRIYKMLIEDKGSGISLIQNMNREFGEQIVPIKVNLSKEVRFLSCISYIESGEVLFSTKISQEVFDELFEFPNGKHDDAVDSISQFITWYFKHIRSYTTPSMRFL